MKPKKQQEEQIKANGEDPYRLQKETMNKRDNRIVAIIFVILSVLLLLTVGALLIEGIKYIFQLIFV